MRKVEPLKPNNGIEVEKSSEQKKRYPKISIPLDALFEARKWDIGKRYKIAMEVEMVGIQDTDFQKEATFELRGIDPGKAAKEPKEEKVKRY